MGRFDPKTQTFTEYPLPGPEPTPYGLGIDADTHIWYSSYNMDVLGRFDPKTGTAVEQQGGLFHTDRSRWMKRSMSCGC